MYCFYLSLVMPQFFVFILSETLVAHWHMSVWTVLRVRNLMWFFIPDFKDFLTSSTLKPPSFSVYLARSQTEVGLGKFRAIDP